MEDCESAHMNIEHVLRTNPHSGRTLDGAALCTDKGKRNTFVHDFALPGIASELIESIETATDTWEEMVSELHQRLARRSVHDKNFASSNAHLVNQEVDGIVAQMDNTQLVLTPTMMINAVQHDLVSFVNALSSDWHVGVKLWKALGDRLRQDVSTVRNEHSPLASGGTSEPQGGSNDDNGSTKPNTNNPK